jgi:hypothetical protein
MIRMTVRASRIALASSLAFGALALPASAQETPS